MRQLFYFSSEQLKRIKPFFRRSYGISRVDDLRVLAELFMSSGMAYNGRMLRLGIAPYKTLYNCFGRWSNIELFK